MAETSGANALDGTRLLPFDQSLLPNHQPDGTDMYYDPNRIDQSNVGGDLSGSNALAIQHWLQKQQLGDFAPTGSIFPNGYLPDLSQLTQTADLLAWDVTQVPQGMFQNPPSYPQDIDSDEEDAYAPNVSTYGCLAFPDSSFWITTRNVLIGRDQKAYVQARKQRDYQRKVDENAAKGLPPPDMPAGVARNYSKSYISEEGGVLGPESDGEESQRPSKRRKTNAGGRISAAEQQREINSRSRIISSRQYVDHTPGAVLVDVNALRPSDDDVPRVSIHGPGPDIVETTKGISREHLKIQYNFKTRVWEAIVLGRNGVFCQDVYYNKDDVITLHCGDRLQIQGVWFTFTLTGVDHGKTGAEDDSESDAQVSKSYSQGGKEMSFDFQSSRGDEMRDTSDSSDVEEALADRALVDSDDSDDSDEEMEDAPSPGKVDDDDEDDDDDDDGANDDLDGTIRETVESDPLDDTLKSELNGDEVDKLGQLLLPPKKRGPGRPPKNGIMSKREERLLKKQAQEEAKKNLPPQEPGEQPQKRKVGRPRKHPLPENAGDQPEKRKYKPRKPKGEDGEEDLEGEKPAKEKSQKHKTPPLELKREDYTEEQLQKPTKNYQLLIDEIMSAAPPKGYSLKQVYKRIQERWPFFYFCVDTKGWESSVRHNLLGSDCFKKIDGNWHRVPGVPLESGKKRKPSDSAAEARPAGMYNGYSHPYQPPTHPQHHGHQQIAHSTGLSQPNLPPRYPPNGQAYQIHQGPPNHIAQPGVAPNQQAPVRPGFPQPQAPATTSQTNSYANVGAPARPQYATNQPPPYNAAYGNRPQPAHVANPAGAAPGTTQNPAQNPAQRAPIARPGQGPPPPMSQHGFQPSQAQPPPNPQRPAPAPHQQQPVSNSAPPAPLGPVIDPILRDFIKDFRAEVIKQLQAKEGKRSEAVAMSVINRGLGLTDRSLTPECEAYEKLILNIFYQHKMTYPTVLASKRRAQEASRAASTTPAPAALVPAPLSGTNGPIAGAPPRTGAASADPTPLTSLLASGTKAPGVNNLTPTSGQTSGPIAAVKAITNGVVSGAVKVESGPGISATTPAIPKPAPAISPGVAATPGTVTPGTATQGTATPASIPANPPPSVPTSTGSVPPKPKPANSPAPGTSSATTGPSIPGPVSAKPVPSTPVTPGPVTSGTATTTAALKPPTNTVSGAPSSVSASPAPGIPATTGSVPPKPVTANPAANTHSTTGPTPPKPVVPAPTPGSATAMATATATATGPPSVSHTQAASPAGPLGAGNPAPMGSRAASTPGTPGTPAPAESRKEVELLDPKLITLILSFKKTILPTLADKLGMLLGESLVMSAVDRLLGFTEETFVQAKNDQQKQHFSEAEKALMMHLETRFKEYVRNRSTSR